MYGLNSVKKLIRQRLALAFALALALGGIGEGWGLCARAAVLYWDGNSTTAGAAVTPTGIWGPNTFWNTSSAGTSATAGTYTLIMSTRATNVFMTADSATNLSTTLGANFSINSLNFTGTGTALQNTPQGQRIGLLT